MAEEKKKVAAAIKYDVENEAVPRIVATGKGSIADEIIKLAEENDVPLYEDPQLAQLLSSLEVDTEIPPELYVLVAEVLSFVYKLERMKSKRQKVKGKLEKYNDKK